MLAISIMGPSWAHNLKIGYKLAALSFISVIIFLSIIGYYYQFF